MPPLTQLQRRDSPCHAHTFGISRKNIQSQTSKNPLYYGQDGIVKTYRARIRSGSFQLFIRLVK